MLKTKIKSIRFFIRRIWLLLFVCIYSGPLIAAPTECVKSLFKYGDEFPPHELGSKVDLVVTKEPNEFGEPGELIYTSTYRAHENWLTFIECASCNPKKFRTGIYLVATKPLPCGLEMGFSISQITKILGEPGDTQNDEYLFYYPDEYQNNYVAIHLVGGKLKALQLIYYQG